LSTSGCAGTTRITDELEDCFLLFRYVFRGKVDGIHTPDKIFNTGKLLRTVNKLQKGLTGPPPFSDKVLEC
jgi:hypothetical protein